MSLSFEPDAYWKMDEASGDRADATGNGNTLTDNNTVGSDSGVLNTAASFVRANSEFFNAAALFQYSPQETGFGLSMWFKTGPLSPNFYYAWAGKSGSHAIYLWLTDLGGGGFSTVLFVVLDGSTRSGTIQNELSDGAWHFLALSVAASDTLPSSRTQFNLWLDGVQLQDDLEIPNLANDFSDFVIGSNGTDGINTWDGEIDEVCWLQRPFTDDEVTELYGSGTPPDPLIEENQRRILLIP